MRRTEQAQGLRLMQFEEVYGRTVRGELSQAEAAEVMGTSERTFRRWGDRFKAEGAERREPDGRYLLAPHERLRDGREHGADSGLGRLFSDTRLARHVLCDLRLFHPLAPLFSLTIPAMASDLLPPCSAAIGLPAMPIEPTPDP